jgi:hypothetical protein
MHAKAMLSLYRILERALERSLGDKCNIVSLAIPEIKIPSTFDPVCIDCRFERNGQEFGGTVQLSEKAVAVVLNIPMKLRPYYDLSTYQPNGYDA